MPKFYRKKSFRYASKDKYSVEHTSVFLQTAATAVGGLYQATSTIVAASPTQGMRKVKHLMVQLNTVGSPAGGEPLYWSVVYVPEGYSVNTMNANPGASLYEPNQFVMACGCNDPEAGPIRISTPISRNLNSGDSIWLVVGSTASAAYVRGVVQYAVTLQ